MNEPDPPFERECFDRVAFDLSFGKTGNYGCALISRLEGVENTDRYLLSHRGEYRFWMKHFCAEVGELAGFLEGELRHDFCVLDEARVGGVHAGNIRPYLYRLRAKRRADDGGAIIAPAAAECRRFLVGRSADESRHDLEFFVFLEIFLRRGVRCLEVHARRSEVAVGYDYLPRVEIFRGNSLIVHCLREEVCGEPLAIAHYVVERLRRKVAHEPNALHCFR